MDSWLLIVIVILALVIWDDRRRTTAAFERRVRALEVALAGRADADPAGQETRSEPGDNVAPEPVGAESVAREWALSLQPPAQAKAGVPRTPRAKPARGPINWEHLLGVRLPVWGGAALLLFGGFLFASYAMEQGVFTPLVRVWACGLGAFAFLLAAVVVRRRAIANSGRIGAALGAAAIGLGYATSYLATLVFGFWPLWVGFAVSAATALAAIAIALQFGRLVLVLGLLGGYVAPVFMAGPTSAYGLVGYLVVVLGASVLVATRREWWLSAMISAGLGLIWTIGLAEMPLTGGVAGLEPQTIWLLAIAGLVVAIEARGGGEDTSWREAFVYLSVVGTGMGLAATALDAEIATLAWAGCVVWIAILSVTSVLVPRRVGLALVAAAGFVLMVLGWRDPDMGTRIAVVVPSAMLIVGSAAVHALSGRMPRLFAGVVPATIMVAIVSSLVDFDGVAGARDLPQFWAGVCLATALAMSAALMRLRRHDQFGPIAPPLAAGVSALVSLALGLVIAPGYYALTAALQVAGLGLIHRRLKSPLLGELAAIYLAGYVGLLVLGQALASGNGAAVLALPIADFLPVLALKDAPLIALIVPGLALVAAGWLFGALKERWIAQAIDLVAVLALALGLHFIIVMSTPVPVRDVIIYGALWVPGQLGLAALAVWGGMRWGREGLVSAGALVGAVVSVGLVALLFLPLARLWPLIIVPGFAVLNFATLALVPGAALLVWMGRMLKSHAQAVLEVAGSAFQAMGGATAFAWMLITIRHAFHGSWLQGVTGQIERYSYSAGMLAFAFALLVLGTWRNSQAVRIASLGVALATVGKLFVFDMSGLDGLGRIGSFIGLGLALLAVSWFYARFVFKTGSGTKEGAAQPAG